MAIKRIDSIFDVSSIKAEKEEVSKALVDVYGNIVNLFDVIQKSKGSSTFAQVSADAKQFEKATKDLSASTVKLEVAQSNLGKKIAEQKVQLQQANKEAKNQATINLTNAGSISRMEAIVVRLRASQKALNLETEEGRKKNALYIKSIDFLNQKIKENSDSATKQRLNVGNYEGSAKIIVDALEKEKQKLEELEKARIRVQNAGGTFQPGNVAAVRTTITGFAGGNSNVPAINNIAKSANTAEEAIAELDKEIAKSRTVVEGFGRITDNPKFLNVAGKVGDAQAELKFFTKALIDLERQGLGSSEAANTLRKNLAELTDQIGDAKAEVKALSSDTRGFDLFAGSVSLAADAFQTFAGAAVLAGASEEDAAEATKVLVAVQSVANGVKGVANELTTRGTAANKLYAFAQNQVTIAMDASATAGQRLRAVLATIGIGALIIGIGLLITNFSKIKDAINGVTDEQKKLDEQVKQGADILTEANKGFADAAANVNELRSEIDLAKKGFIDKDEVVKHYNETIGKTTGIVKSVTEAENELNSKAEAYIKFMFLKAKATAAANKATELLQKQLAGDAFKNIGETFVPTGEASADRQLKKIADINKKRNQEQAQSDKAAVDYFLNLQQDALNEAAQIAKDNKFSFAGAYDDKQDKNAKKKLEDRLKAELDLEKRNYQAYKQLLLDEANEKIRVAQGTVDDENALLKDQLKAIEDIAVQRKNIATIELADQLQAEKEVKDGKIIIHEKTEQEKLQATQAYSYKINEINDQTLKSMAAAEAAYTEKVKAENERRLKAALDALEKEQQAKRDKAGIAYNEDIIALNGRFEKGLLSQKEYNKKREDIEFAYQVESLQREIDYQRKLADTAVLSTDQKAEALRKLSDLEKELSDATLAHEKANDEERARSKEKLVDVLMELENSLADLVSALASASTEKQLQELETRQQASEANYNREVENINNSTLSQKQKDEELAKLAKAKEVRDLAYQQRQKDLQIKQAKFDKATAIFQAVINIAAGVTKALARADFITAGIIAATGAAQVAAIAAKPIPKYAKGLDNNSRAHVGIYGEAGPELVEKPGQRPFIADSPTVDFLPVGTSITPLAGDELNRLMYNNMLVNMANGLELINREKKKSNEVVDALKWHARVLGKAISKSNRPVNNKIKVDLGWDRYLRDQVYY